MTEASEPGLSRDSIPDYVEPVMGVRRWDVVGGILKSTGVSFAPPWQPGQHARATCVLSLPYWDEEAHELAAPVEDCSCGYHAWFDLETCNQRFPMQLPRVAISERGMIGSIPPSYQAANETVAGVVSSWGKIILCEYGFRAEYMKIEALILPENTSVEVFGHSVSIKSAYKALAETYNVPLVPEQVVDEVMRERGVVLEPDPVPAVPHDDLVAAATIGQMHSLADAFKAVSVSTQHIANITRGADVQLTAPEKPRWWKRAIWVELASVLTAILGLAILGFGHGWVALPLIAAANVLAWLPVFIGGGGDD